MNSIPISKKNKPVREIFLNIFIIIFIFMCYFYVSEIFGSISKPFITDAKFSVHFGITLLIFTFFSILAKFYHGFISGFIGEFLYQLAYYKTIYLDWCYLIGFWGFVCGIHNSNLLKYNEIKNFFLNSVFLLINSFIMMISIILIEKFFHQSKNGQLFIFLGNGLKFFVESLLTVIFLIPFLLFLYNKAFNREERHLYYMILTHHPIYMNDHTFYFRFGNTFCYFCSRCSGVVIGGMLSYFFTHLIEKIYNIEINSELAILLCIILPIPGLIDWGTQRMQLRTSTTESRLFTGFIIGNALHFMSFTYEYYYFMIFLLILYFSILFLLMYLGHKKEMKVLNEAPNENLH